MVLAFIMGRLPQLAEKEIAAAATILPFPWSGSIVQSGVYLLKSAENTEMSRYKENGSVKEEIWKQIYQLQNRLGGVLKIVQVRRQVPPEALVKEIVQDLGIWAGKSKFSFGLGLYTSRKSSLNLFELGMKIKQAAKIEGIPIRFVPASSGQNLSTAQVFHNRLAFLDKKGEPQTKGAEVILFQEGDEYWLGRTLTVQDIDSYSKRDFSIPAADPVSGLLSPKLAQAMINLAVAEDFANHPALYDPFCGHGRLLLEGSLMGLPVFGSDISDEKVKAARSNLEWLGREYNLPVDTEAIWQQDATQSRGIKALHQKIGSDKLWFLVSEPYLGKSLRQPLTATEAGEWRNELEPLYERFFTVWATASFRPKRMLVVFPQVKLEQGEASLYENWVDRLSALGYSSSVLAYYTRPDSLISRNLVRVEYRE